MPGRGATTKDSPSLLRRSRDGDEMLNQPRSGIA